MRPSPRILAFVFLTLLAARTAAGEAIASKTTLDNSNAAIAKAKNNSLPAANTIPAAARERILNVIGHDQRAYFASANAGGIRMENPSQRMSAEFSASGMYLQTGQSSWGIKLTGLGYGNQLHALNPIPPMADANRVEFRREFLTDTRSVLTTEPAFCSSMD